MEAKNLSWDEINIGDSSVFSRTWSMSEGVDFATLSGDFNPLHTSTSYASTTEFKIPVVHGMLVASLVSKLVGMYLPGKKCLLLKNDIVFKKPVFYDEEIVVSGVVESKSISTKIIVINIKFNRGIELVAESKTFVKLI